jgi:hypothetical protein
VIEPTSIGLYLDEDIPLGIARLLQGYGFTAVTTRDAGNLGRDDERQLTYATTHGLTMLTHNRSDFLLLHRDWQASGRSHAGIIAAHRNPPYEVLRRILPLLSAVTPTEMRGQFRYL